MRNLILTLFITLCVIPAAGSGKMEQKTIKEYLSKNIFAIDSEADAVVLNESSNIEVREKKEEVGAYIYYTYTQVKHVYTAIKIISTAGQDAGNVHFYYHSAAAESYYSNVEGTTYNLGANGSIAETSVSKAEVYKKQLSPNTFEVSFSLPSVKAGSVIEYSYDISGPLPLLQSEWHIEGPYPKLQTSYRITYPPDVELTAISEVKERLKEYTSEDDALAGTDKFCHSKADFYKGDNLHFWLRRDVQAVRSEPYVNSLPNHLEIFALQLTGYMTEKGITHIINSWDKLNEGLLENELISAVVTANNNFLGDVTDSIKKANPTPAALTRAIYTYVRNNFNTDDREELFSSKSLRKIFQAGFGSSAEINFLLCAMLVHADIKATPILLSTIGSEAPSPIFPVLSRFNYLACAVNERGSDYILLDASDRNNIYGQLPEKCYNGYARTIEKHSKGMYLQPDLITDKTVTGINIFNVRDSAASVKITLKMGLLSSATLRKKWKNDGSAKQHFIDEQKHDLPDNVRIEKVVIAQENEQDTNLTITFTGNIVMPQNTGKWYMNAILVKNLHQNPFKSTKRRLPVEFPYRSQSTYFLSVKLPDDMQPGELSPPIVMDLDSGSIVYKKSYSFYEAMRTLTVNTDYSVNKTTYGAEDYDILRNFVAGIVKQENEMILINRAGAK